MKKILSIIILIFSILSASAQIGYQVALLDKATGEPRANETVAVELTISDSAGGTIYSGSQAATTNDFGMLSLAVGDANTFSNVDWSKLPLFISATVDGTLLGRTQILSVPVAEHAKHTGTLTKEKLCSKTWKHSGGGWFGAFNFSLDGKGSLTSSLGSASILWYYIQGNFVMLEIGDIYEDGRLTREGRPYVFVFIESKEWLVGDGYVLH